MNRYEAGSFVPLLQASRPGAIELAPTTDVKALMAANFGSYDQRQDPLWNGDFDPQPKAFSKQEIAFYQCDHLGTPQELTDHEGKIAWEASYKAWGWAKEAIGEAARKAGFKNPIRFQGQYFDEETGLHYNRYRYYDPHSGRFASKDPSGIWGGINIYAYGTNPIEFVDPKGLISNTSGPAKITAADVTDKSRSDIRDIAVEKGLVPCGKPDSQGLPRKWKCPQTNNQRLRLDSGHIDEKTGLPYSDPKAAAPHVHAYEPDGSTKITSPQDGNPHFPTKGP